jgi:hypothetical protein
MSVNEFDRTELKECQIERNHCGNCKNGLCSFNPLISTDSEVGNNALRRENVVEKVSGFIKKWQEKVIRENNLASRKKVSQLMEIFIGKEV